MAIEMLVKKITTGYSVYAAAYPVFTTGGNLLERKANNMLEALNLYVRW